MIMSKEPTLEAGSRARPGASVISVTRRGTALTNLNPNGHSQECSPHQDSGNKSIHIQTPVFLVLGLGSPQVWFFVAHQRFCALGRQPFAGQGPQKRRGNWCSLLRSYTRLTAILVAYAYLPQASRRCIHWLADGFTGHEKFNSPVLLPAG